MTEPTAPKDIDEALFQLQADPPVLRKDRDGQVGSQRTKYADLIQANAVITPRLNALGLLWVTEPTLRMIAGQNGSQAPAFVLNWEMKHVASGTSRKGEYPLPNNVDPMKYGSALTYARRYALITVTNTVAEDEDDDGRGYRERGAGMAQRASARQQSREQQSTAQRAQPPVRPERARPEQQPEIVPAQQHQPDEPVRGRGGLVTEPMTKKLAICMKEIGLTSAEDRKNFITDMIGRVVASSKELTFPEGRGLIDAIEKAKDSPDPLVAAEEIYRRTTGALPAADPVATEPARKRAPRRPPETRSQADQTRDAVLGRPLRDGEELPPWEPQHPTLLDAPDVADWPEQGHDPDLRIWPEP